MKFSHQEQGSFIEEWGPRTVSSSAHDTSFLSMSDGAMKPDKKVAFSDFSCRRVYTPDAYYEALKCYTSADRMRFKEEAIREGFRIRHLISLCSLPTETGRAVQELLKNGLLSCEDLLGIDHLCSLKLAEKSLNGRRSYTNLVLSAQEELRRGDGLVDAEKLAVIAISGSLGCFEKAVHRAALALN